MDKTRDGRMVRRRRGGRRNSPRPARETEQTGETLAMPRDALPKEIVILSGARTAIGTFGGSLAGTPPTQTGALVAKTAMERAGIEPDRIGHVAYGHVINTEPRDMYLSRVSAIEAGIPDSVPAMNVNRLCGSGAQAIVSAAQAIALGDADYALAGGAEAMSRGPYLLPAARFGQKMGDIKGIDMMVGALNDPFGHGHMGITAENVAAEHQISREEMDAFALESQARAKAAIEAGHFNEQIVPVEVKKGRDMVAFATDEHPRMTSAEALVGLRPAFRIGPVPAVQSLMERTGLTAEDFDVIESNEAFAAQACAVNKGLGLDPAKVNPNGGAIALGHPVGATGAIITVKCLYELERIGGRYGLVTMCIGGGQGIALAIERL